MYHWRTSHAERLRIGRTTVARLIPAVAVLLLSSCGDDDDNAASTTLAGTSAPATSASSGATTTSPASDKEWENVVAAASKEGEVKFYSVSLQPTLDRLTEAFEAKYPDVELTAIKMLPAELSGRLDAEIRSGNLGADVVLSENLPLITGYDQKGAFAKFAGPQRAKIDAAKFNPTGTYLLVGGYPIGLSWNTKLFPGGLKEYRDLINPSLKGKIAIIDPTVAATQVKVYANYEKAAGPRFLEDLAALEPRVYGGSAAIEAAVLSGEVSAALYATPANILRQKRDGQPVDFALPSGAAAFANYVGILEGADHPNAARLLANFLLTAEGQEIMYGDGLTVLPNVKSIGPIDGASILTTAPTAEEITQFTARFRSLFQ